MEGRNLEICFSIEKCALLDGDCVCSCLSPDLQALALCYSSSHLWIYDSAGPSRQERAQLPHAPSAICFVSNESLAVGMDDGSLHVYDLSSFRSRNGSRGSPKLVLSKTLHPAARILSFQLFNLLTPDPHLWVLLEGGIVCSLPADTLCPLPRAQQPHGQRQIACTKVWLPLQKEVAAIAICSPRPSLLEATSQYHTCVIVGAGEDPAIVLYPVTKATKTFALGHLAWAVAEKLSGAAVWTVKGAIKLVGRRGKSKLNTSGDSVTSSSSKNQGSPEREKKERSSDDPVPCEGKTLIEDGRRRITSTATSGNLVATSDSFGRVMLLDAQARAVVRMWKGLRQAQCGWLEVIQVKGAAGAEVWDEPGGHQGLRPVPMPEGGVVTRYLAILAPQRGYVELWLMKHGPCTQVLLVKPGTTLVAIPSSRTHLARCCLLVPTESGKLQVELLIPEARHLEVLQGQPQGDLPS
ncbi:unnamed protein product [Chrysoparadoxa australica]